MCNCFRQAGGGINVGVYFFEKNDVRMGRLVKELSEKSGLSHGEDGWEDMAGETRKSVLANTTLFVRRESFTPFLTRFRIFPIVLGSFGVPGHTYPLGSELLLLGMMQPYVFPTSLEPILISCVTMAMLTMVMLTLILCVSMVMLTLPALPNPSWHLTRRQNT